MPKANDVVSANTRRLIRKARNRGLMTEASVALFANRAKKAVRAFDAEVNPLHLSDEDYAEVVRTSGLEHLLRAARIMEHFLSSVTERAS